MFLRPRSSKTQAMRLAIRVASRRVESKSALLYQDGLRRDATGSLTTRTLNIGVR